MSQQENRIADSLFLKAAEAGAAADEHGVLKLSAARLGAAEETGHSIASQLNGPLTALLLYMEELKQHSHRLSPETGERDRLQRVVENALQQTERVCALVKQAGGAPARAGAAALAANAAWRARAERAKESITQGAGENIEESGRCSVAMRSPDAGRKPLTRREREVLTLISQGYSNKQGALRMQISPRTFESHRAEAMRKLGARNTADLVRAVLLQPIG
ncbi:MAG: helix-turn-helix transcriptional regulator [Bradyrhizobium sp.]|nr:helix-turn-helix transcriptional regulator [Bradyrhizobium sp.]